MKEINEYILNYLSNYSFSNIDILLKKEAPSLNSEDLVEKITVQKRGGYCFEHNKFLFDSFSKSGKEIKSYLGRVVYGSNHDVPRTHRFNIITLENKKYLIDVGFGPSTPVALIPLTGEDTKDYFGDTYKIIKISDVFHLQLLKETSYFTLYTFDLNNYTESDFMLANYYTGTKPGTKFVEELIVSLKKRDGKYFLNNFNFTKIINGERSDHQVTNKEELGEILKNYFMYSLKDEEISFIYNKIKTYMTTPGEDT